MVREGGASVALDLTVTPELRLEGLARELVRAVQDLRKDAGLNVSDRIQLAVEGDGEVAEAVAAHGDHLRAETLAVELLDAPRGEGARAEVEVDGTPVRLWLRPIDAD
jgi:isoleucyl-tRNA synthetase